MHSAFSLSESIPREIEEPEATWKYMHMLDDSAGFIYTYILYETAAGRAIRINALWKPSTELIEPSRPPTRRNSKQLGSEIRVQPQIREVHTAAAAVGR